MEVFKKRVELCRECILLEVLNKSRFDKCTSTKQWQSSRGINLHKPVILVISASWGFFHWRWQGWENVCTETGDLFLDGILRNTLHSVCVIFHRFSMMIYLKVLSGTHIRVAVHFKMWEFTVRDSTTERNGSK